MPKEIKSFMEEHNSTPLQNKITLEELIKRPEMTYKLTSLIDKDSRSFQITK